jgi:3-deoxy-7-phosphoheptulonate synthase
MIDFSHANSLKQYHRQLLVGDDVAEQIANGDQRITGIMMEANINAGRQDVVAGQDLVYGQSITDACLGWDDSVQLLRKLAEAVQQRRNIQN